MANKAACWGRSCRTLKPKGRLSHAENRRLKGSAHTKERIIKRKWAISNPFSSTSILPLISVHFPPYGTAYYMRSGQTRLAMRDQVGQAGRAPYFLVSQGKDNWYFCSQRCIIWISLVCRKILLKLANVHNFYFRLTLLFYLSYISSDEGIWAWWRLIPGCVGGCLRAGRRRAPASFASTSWHSGRFFSKEKVNIHWLPTMCQIFRFPVGIS